MVTELIHVDNNKKYRDITICLYFLKLLNILDIKYVSFFFATLILNFFDSDKYLMVMLELCAEMPVDLKFLIFTKIGTC